MDIKTALKNKTINDVLIFHIISNFTGYDNNGTPKGLLIAILLFNVKHNEIYHLW